MKKIDKIDLILISNGNGTDDSQPGKLRSFFNNAKYASYLPWKNVSRA